MAPQAPIIIIITPGFQSNNARHVSGLRVRKAPILAAFPNNLRPPHFPRLSQHPKYPRMMSTENHGLFKDLTALSLFEVFIERRTDKLLHRESIGQERSSVPICSLHINKKILRSATGHTTMANSLT